MLGDSALGLLLPVLTFKEALAGRARIYGPEYLSNESFRNVAQEIGLQEGPGESLRTARRFEAIAGAETQNKYKVRRTQGSTQVASSMPELTGFTLPESLDELSYRDLGEMAWSGLIPGIDIRRVDYKDKS